MSLTDCSTFNFYCFQRDHIQLLVYPGRGHVLAARMMALKKEERARERPRLAQVGREARIVTAKRERREGREGACHARGQGPYLFLTESGREEARRRDISRNYAYNYYCLRHDPIAGESGKNARFLSITGRAWGSYIPIDCDVCVPLSDIGSRGRGERVES